MRERAALRMFVAVRNAARCVHMSAAKYTTSPASANASAARPYAAAWVASAQFGATATRSRSTNHTHTSIAMDSTAFTPDSTHPNTVSFLCPPAKSRSRAMGLRCLGALGGLEGLGASDAPGAFCFPSIDRRRLSLMLAMGNKITPHPKRRGKTTESSDLAEKVNKMG